MRNERAGAWPLAERRDRMTKAGGIGNSGRRQWRPGKTAEVGRKLSLHLTEISVRSQVRNGRIFHPDSDRHVSTGPVRSLRGPMSMGRFCWSSSPLARRAGRRRGRPRQAVRLPRRRRATGLRADARGNRVPDFSHAGYGGGAAIPDVPVRVVVPAGSRGQRHPHPGGDRLRRRRCTPDANGLRGAVLLLAGRHEVAGHLRISASGVVLRGQGKDTVLVATGTDRRALIQIRGRADRDAEDRRARGRRQVRAGRGDTRAARFGRRAEGRRHGRWSSTRARRSGSPPSAWTGSRRATRGRTSTGGRAP